MILTEEQRGTAAFDLEKARAMICHYRIENPGDADTDCGLEDLIRQANLAEEALDEIERLNAHINSARIESLRIAEEQAAEIERLRASLIDLHAEYINTLEKNPECSAWDLDEQSDADQKRLRRNAAHAISIVEPPIYLQAEQRATKIKELEDALAEERVIGEGGFRAGQCEFWYIEDLLEESCMELDGLCDWAKCPRKHELCDVAYQQLAEEGKIGPDADAKPHCWQITEERKAVILHCKRMLTFLKEDDAPCYDVEKITKDESVLVAMLEEAK